MKAGFTEKRNSRFNTRGLENDEIIHSQTHLYSKWASSFSTLDQYWEATLVLCQFDNGDLEWPSLLSLLVALTASTTIATVVQPSPALSGQWTIADFQGQYFNLVNTQPTSLTPVQAWRDPTVTASQWLFVNTSTSNVFEIVNVGTGSWLSYSALVTGGEAIQASVVGNQQSTTWRFTQPTGMLIETSCNLSVTSYLTGASGSSPVGPSCPLPRSLSLIALVHFTLEPHQIFKMVAVLCNPKANIWVLRIIITLEAKWLAGVNKFKPRSRDETSKLDVLRTRFEIQLRVTPPVKGSFGQDVDHRMVHVR
ncbi:hypothetical protein B0H17DRAFT_1145640 [Mycena rosella]|uniref:Uncharacterized protein n=1 Tax=Mycena rosella TaxID=1033263 RepID=A0AAD7CQI7_MYCRO|nr:hypothetical protein B0H17DRAFT_1145640 [Mycena rosella]